MTLKSVLPYSRQIDSHVVTSKIRLTNVSSRQNKTPGFRPGVFVVGATGSEPVALPCEGSVFPPAYSMKHGCNLS